jgi:hypothetical protein
MGSCVAPEDMVGDAAEEMVADILRRLEGRRDMNVRTALAHQRSADYTPPLIRQQAYECAIQDVITCARAAGFLR